jgi:hypothetical protein
MTLHCPHCHHALDPAQIRSMAASLASHARTVHRGTATVLRPCKYCGVQLGHRAMRKHVPVCAKRTTTTKKVEAE